MTINKVSRPFSSIKTVSELLIILLAIRAAIALVAIALSFYEVMVLSRTLSAAIDPISRDEIRRIIGVTYLVVYLVVAAFSLLWFYRAHRNLPSLGVLRGKYSSPWNILLFLVPIANLYFGYDLMRELWKQSNPDVGFSDDFLSRHASPLKQYSSKTALIGLWWFFTIASTVVARTAFNSSVPNAGFSDYIRDTVILMISDAFGIVGSIMLIALVTKINERQKEKHRRLVLHETEARSVPAFT
jgi:hypothetical protein